MSEKKKDWEIKIKEYQIDNMKMSIKGLPIKSDFPKLPKDWFTKIQPMTTVGLAHGHTYFAKKVLDDVWETCTQIDISDPDYEPFLAITSSEGVAIYDVNRKPVVCTDRRIFKVAFVDFERAKITEEIWVLPAKDGKPPFKKKDGELFIAWKIGKKE